MWGKLWPFSRKDRQVSRMWMWNEGMASPGAQAWDVKVVFSPQGAGCCWAGGWAGHTGSPHTHLESGHRGPQCHSEEFRFLSASTGEPVEIFEKGIWKMLLVTFYRKMVVGEGRAEAEPRPQGTVLWVSIPEQFISLQVLAYCSSSSLDCTLVKGRGHGLPLHCRILNAVHGTPSIVIEWK